MLIGDLAVYLCLYVQFICVVMEFEISKTSKGGECLISENFKFRRVRRADASTVTWRYVPWHWDNNSESADDVIVFGVVFVGVAKNNVLPKSSQILA